MYFKAKAKLNLFLHITGKRKDNYHLLESMVAFTDEVFDELNFSINKESEFLLEGNFASLIDIKNNLILKTIEFCDIKESLKIKLIKNIPVAAGMGGGSSDAAATLKAIEILFSKNIDINTTATKLGADIPVCYKQKSSYFAGIGEQVIDIINFPIVYALIVNPNILISTQEIFQKIKQNFSSKINKTLEFKNYNQLINFLKNSTNDLEKQVIKDYPIIEKVIQEIAILPNCSIARMSGSGSTCFGLFEKKEDVEKAKEILKNKFTGWWIECSKLS